MFRKIFKRLRELDGRVKTLEKINGIEGVMSNKIKKEHLTEDQKKRLLDTKGKVDNFLEEKWSGGV